MSSGTLRTYSFYDLLGVAPTADAETVRRAYRKHALECHPDKNRSSGATEQFLHVEEAYRILSNPTTKRVYDTYGDDYRAGTTGTLTEDSVTVATRTAPLASSAAAAAAAAAAHAAQQDADECICVFKARRPATAGPGVLDTPLTPVLTAVVPDTAPGDARLRVCVARATVTAAAAAAPVPHDGNPRKRPHRSPCTGPTQPLSHPSDTILMSDTEQQQQQQTQQRQQVQQQQQQKEQQGDIELRVDVTLEEVYRGCTKRVAYERDECCDACAGTGSSRVVHCVQCCGTGTVLGDRRAFPDDCDEAARAAQRVGVVACALCGGRGVLAVPVDRCRRCRGARVVRQPRELTVHVPRGAPAGHTLVYRGAGSQRLARTSAASSSSTATAIASFSSNNSSSGASSSYGDVTVVLHLLQPSQPHVPGVFERDGDDLRVVWPLSLREALCGYVVHLRHLDGRDLVLRSPAGKVTRPGDVLVVPGKGMPVFAPGATPQQQQHPAYGRLLITMSVQFPPDNSFSQQDIAILERIIPQ